MDWWNKCEKNQSVDENFNKYDFDDYCYSHVCLADHRSPQELPFYKDHWLIDSGASDHITPYLGLEFSRENI
jgi:hypothetical protein